MTEQAVGHLDLQDFLKGKCGLPRTEASTIWALLVNHISTRPDDYGLPLKLVCDICNKGYGECQDNSYINSLVKRLTYWPQQTPHWKMTIDSLKECKRKLDNMEIRLLGSPEKLKPRRKLLYAWIDSL